MITVIIPSKGREELKFSLYSLISQTNSKWNCIVSFDNVDKTEMISKLKKLEDERIKYLFNKEKLGNGQNGGGAVRNQAINIAYTDWVCFLDDDDSFEDNYIEKFYEETNNNPDADVIIFKMQYDNGVVRPPDGLKQLICGQVGISFAVRLQFLNNNNLRFVNSKIEDFELLKKLQDLGANIHFSEHIVYNVGFSNI